MLDKKAKERLEFLRVVMATEKNYGAYREALRNAQLPSLPFLGTSPPHHLVRSPPKSAQAPSS